MAGGLDAWGGFVQLTGCKVTDLSSDDSGNAAYASSTPGTAGSETLAASSALLVNYTINRRYRGGKPRNYFPWGVANYLASGDQWNGAFLDTAPIAVAKKPSIPLVT